MVWSKKKKILYSFICDSLKDRIDFNVIKYRKSHDALGRVVILLDKKEILSTSTVKFEYELYKKLEYYSEDETIEEYDKRWEVACKDLNYKGYFSELDFFDALETYMSNSIEESIKSDNTIIKILAIIDRRLGKRRLRLLKNNIENENYLVKYFYDIRSSSENI